MGYENYISEAEATTFAGVSSATLGRFVEAGYLEIEQDGDGLRLYSRGELANLFGIADSSESKVIQLTAHKQQVAESYEMPAAAAANSDYVDPGQPAFTAQPESNRQDLPPEAVSWQSHVPGNGAPLQKDSTPFQSTLSQRESTLSQRESTLHQVFRQPDPPLRSTAVDALEREVTKFKNIVELQEKILTMKDEEIKNLKNERDWLRGRLEKLEEKTERDQILLLAETQTIRQLIAIAERRRSPVRAALEWLGLLDTPHPTGGTIEIGQNQKQEN